MAKTLHTFGLEACLPPFMIMDAAHKRLRDVIGTLDYYELLKIEKDLEQGGSHLKDFVKGEILLRERAHHVYCSNCQNEIDPRSASTFTLVFGPDDFRKKATFCGSDCLNYFLQHLTEIKRKK